MKRQQKGVKRKRSNSKLKSKSNSSTSTSASTSSTSTSSAVSFNEQPNYIIKRRKKNVFEQMNVELISLHAGDTWFGNGEEENKTKLLSKKIEKTQQDQKRYQQAKEFIQEHTSKYSSASKSLMILVEWITQVTEHMNRVNNRVNKEANTGKLPAPAPAPYSTSYPCPYPQIYDRGQLVPGILIQGSHGCGKTFQVDQALDSVPSSRQYITVVDNGESLSEAEIKATSQKITANREPTIFICSDAYAKFYFSHIRAACTVQLKFYKPYPNQILPILQKYQREVFKNTANSTSKHRRLLTDQELNSIIEQEDKNIGACCRNIDLTLSVLWYGVLGDFQKNTSTSTYSTSSSSLLNKVDPTESRTLFSKFSANHAEPLSRHAAISKIFKRYEITEWIERVLHTVQMVVFPGYSHFLSGYMPEWIYENVLQPYREYFSQETVTNGFQKWSEYQQVCSLTTKPGEMQLYNSRLGLSFASNNDTIDNVDNYNHLACTAAAIDACSLADTMTFSAIQTTMDIDSVFLEEHCILSCFAPAFLLLGNGKVKINKTSEGLPFQSIRNQMRLNKLPLPLTNYHADLLYVVGAAKVKELFIKASLGEDFRDFSLAVQSGQDVVETKEKEVETEKGKEKEKEQEREHIEIMNLFTRADLYKLLL